MSHPTSFIKLVGIILFIFLLPDMAISQSNGDTLFLKKIQQVNDSVVKIQIHIKSNKCDCWTLRDARIKHFNKIHKLSNRNINPGDTLFLPTLRYNLNTANHVFVHDYKPHYSAINKNITLYYNTKYVRAGFYIYFKEEIIRIKTN